MAAAEAGLKAASQAADAATNQTRIKLFTREEIDRIENLARLGSSEFLRVLDAVRYWHDENEDGDPEKAQELRALLAHKP